MILQTDEGNDCARDLVAVLLKLDELEKRSPADADALWRTLAAHVRSKAPHTLMELEHA